MTRQGWLGITCALLIHLAFAPAGRAYSSQLPSANVGNLLAGALK